jgi:hypothetical protein
VFITFAALTLMSVTIQRTGVSGASVTAFAIRMLGLPGLVTPFITTAPVFLAVSEIRRSNGPLAGLRLAFADAVFFPFLLLDCLIFGAYWFALQDAGAPTDIQAVNLLSVVTTPALPNALAGWWLWRRVSSE